MIRIITEGISAKVSSKRLICAWIAEVAKSEGFHCGEITIYLCSDEHLLSINKEFLKHHTYTDIITFDYGSNKTISGELFISYDRVKDNAIKFKTTASNELYRVIIHGIFHLCGYKDKSDKEKRQMRLKEDDSLRKLKI